MAESFTVEYLEPVEIDAPPLPEEFSSSRVRQSMLVVAAIVLVIVAAVTLLPGLGSLRERFAGAQPDWLALAVVLQVLACASYVLAFRVVFCRRKSFLALGGILLTTHVLPGSPGLLYGLIPAAIGISAIAGTLGVRPLAHRIAGRVKSDKLRGAMTALGDGVIEALHLLRAASAAWTAA